MATATKAFAAAAPRRDPLPPGSAPVVVNRSFDIIAEVVVPDGGGDGVLYAHGGRFGGHALYVFDGRPMYHYNLLGSVRYTLTAEVVLTPGEHTVTLGFVSDVEGYGLGGTAPPSVDGQPCVDALRPHRALADVLRGRDGHRAADRHSRQRDSPAVCVRRNPAQDVPDPALTDRSAVRH